MLQYHKVHAAGLQLKTPDVRGFTGLQKYFQVHLQAVDYFVVFEKYCQRWDAAAGEFDNVSKCAVCKPVRMPGPIWAEISKRKPLLP